MDRNLALYRAADHERAARQICEKQPGYGSHRYRGDPPEAVASQQLAERYRLAAADVTLDGEPAKIVGVANLFATVMTRDGRHEGEWAWPTAARIVAESGGAFRL